MRALVLYCLLTAAGAFLAALIGLFVQREISEVASLLVFLPLFFLNFGLAWLITKFAMDRYVARNSAECPQCQGRGLVAKSARDFQCEACRGSGRVPLAPAGATLVGAGAAR